MVLIVLSVLAIVAFVFSDRMRTERRATDIAGQQLQARQLVESGVDLARKFLGQDLETQLAQGGTYENSRFHGCLVVNNADPKFQGYFAIVAPKVDASDENTTGVRYGFEDESSRFNLNALVYIDKLSPGSGRRLLMSLPGMTEDIADSILDFIDDDENQREFGAERDYYSGLTPPYAPKNGQLDSVEELLQVKGVTPELLFGTDANRNGILDKEEQLTQEAESTTGATGSFRGWAAYMTLHSYESNKLADCTQKIDLNGTDLQKLHDDLAAANVDGAVADFVIAYRQNGAYTGTKEPMGQATLAIDYNQQAKAKLTSVLDLVDAKIQVKTAGGNNNNATIVPSPIKSIGDAELLNKLLDVAAVTTSKRIPGRININQAPRTVLLGIPGMTEEFVDQIISARPKDSEQNNATSVDSEFRHETWILTRQIVDLKTMKYINPFVTAGGNVFRAQVVGYFGEGGPACRCEVVIDATGDLPRIVFWRELSHLGRGYPVETLGLGN